MITELLASAQQALKAIKIFNDVLNWWQERRYGSVLVTHPQNGDVVPLGAVRVLGSHKGAKGHLWLITKANDRYWPQCEINLLGDGRWDAAINTGSDLNIQKCNLLLVRMSDFAHSLFKDIKDRSGRAKYHGPVQMNPPPGSQFKCVQSLVFNVRPSPPNAAPR